MPYETIEIERAVAAMGETLSPAFAGTTADTTEENIQSRLRGVILMAISNKFGPMVLTTGNKSEMSVGYATLYGDMCGGYNVLKDIYKTEVFALARWRNQFSPEGALGPRAASFPSALSTSRPARNCAPDQTDQDSLPPYDILDGILECLVEQEMSFADTVARGFDPATVKRIEQLLYVSEYKRRQAPPGVKISVAQFRPRPALSHHQCFPGCAMRCHRPLRAVAHRLAACRQCPHRAAELSVRPQDWAANSCCGSTIPMRRAPPRNSRTRSIAIWTGWASRHDLTDRQFGRLKIYSTAFYRLQAAGRVYPCYETEAELERQRALAQAAQAAADL